MGWDVWWIWIAGGIALAIFEMMIPGFIFLGFAIGAVVVGLLLLIGGGLAGWLTSSVSMLVFMFAMFSLVAWVVLRKVIGVRHGQSRIVERDIND